MKVKEIQNIIENKTDKELYELCKECYKEFIDFMNTEGDCWNCSDDAKYCRIGNSCLWCAVCVKEMKKRSWEENQIPEMSFVNYNL